MSRTTRLPAVAAVAAAVVAVTLVVNGLDRGRSVRPEQPPLQHTPTPKATISKVEQKQGSLAPLLSADNLGFTLREPPTGDITIHVNLKGVTDPVTVTLYELDILTERESQLAAQSITVRKQASDLHAFDVSSSFLKANKVFRAYLVTPTGERVAGFMFNVTQARKKK